MAATSLKTKDTVTLKGSAEMVVEYFSKYRRKGLKNAHIDHVKDKNKTQAYLTCLRVANEKRRCEMS